MTLQATVYREGTGTALVLLHAFPIDHHMWDECAQKLISISQNFPILAYDMPGAGDAPYSEFETNQDEDGAYPDALESMSHAIVEDLQQRGYEKAVFVGLSMGGYWALAIHALHPSFVAGIGLFDTKASADSPQAREKRLTIAHECELEQTIEPVMGFARATESDSTVKQSQAFIHTFTNWIEQQTPSGIAFRQRMAAGRKDYTGQLSRITVPAAVLCGDLDPSSPPEVMRPIAQAMIQAQATLTVIPDCGHFSAVEHPEPVARALNALMKRI